MKLILLGIIKSHMVAFTKLFVHALGSLFIKPFILLKRNKAVITTERAINILYICLAYRGDLVLNFPAISALKRHIPYSKITCWVRGYNEYLANLNPDIYKVIVYDDFRSGGVGIFRELLLKFSHKRFFKRIKENKFDMCIDDSGYAFTALVCAFARIPFRIGRNSQGFGFLYHHEFPYDFNAPLIKKRFKLLSPLNISIKSDSELIPRINIPLNMREAVLKRAGLDSIESGYVTVHPYAGWAAKNWNNDKFACVISEFAGFSGLLPVFIGGPSDKEQISDIVNKISVNTLNLAGTLSLPEIAALISGAVIHFGVDSIGSHLAVATGVKSLTLFGPTNPRLIAILNDKNIAALKKILCTPADGKIYCLKDAGRSCRDVVCMKELEADEVLSVLKDHWLGKKLAQVVVF